MAVERGSESGAISKSEDHVSRLAGILAHELRNPLASATTNIAVAADLCEEADPRTPFLKRAEHEMDRIRILLNACLELACAGRVQPRTVVVEELLRAVADTFRGRGGPVIRIVFDAGLEAKLDPVLIARAMENLCENAMRALMGRDGEILMKATAGEGEIRLVVEDSGPGVAPELAERVFEPFVSGTRGSGLGLAIVRQVAEAHGGKACATKGRLGGARFEIAIPERE